MTACGQQITREEQLQLDKLKVAKELYALVAQLTTEDFESTLSVAEENYDELQTLVDSAGVKILAALIKANLAPEEWDEKDKQAIEYLANNNETPEDTMLTKENLDNFLEQARGIRDGYKKLILRALIGNVMLLRLQHSEAASKVLRELFEGVQKLELSKNVQKFFSLQIQLLE